MQTITDDNPLREGMRMQKTAEPCVVIIFGASGDLTKRKLVPALYRLVQERLVPAEFAIVGMARSEMTDQAFRDKMKTAVAQFSEAKQGDEALWNSLPRSLLSTLGHWQAGDYRKLGELLIASTANEAPRAIVVLSFRSATILCASRRVIGSLFGCSKPDSWVRVIIEPFGSIWKALARQIADSRAPRRVADHRIDHYLGKETVQNLLAFRFANGIFEPLWNRQYIDHADCNAESVGAEGAVTMKLLG